MDAVCKARGGEFNSSAEEFTDLDRNLDVALFTPNSAIFIGDRPQILESLLEFKP